MVSPGLSSVPANRLPIITVSAPAAIALVMSPEYLMPPSEISGTPEPLVARAHSAMAVICGTPAPETTRVVQIEPGPREFGIRLAIGSQPRHLLTGVIAEGV